MWRREDGIRHPTLCSEDGRVLEVHDALDHLIAKNTYGAKRSLETTQDARGTITQFTYDELNRVFQAPRSIRPD